MSDSNGAISNEKNAYFSPYFGAFWPSNGNIYALDSNALEKIAGEQKPETVKIFNMLKAIHGLVAEKAHGEPYLIDIGDRAEKIAKDFEQRHITTQEALERLEQLLAELKDAEKSRDNTGLSPEAFAVYWFMKREGLAEPIKVAEQVSAAFEQYAHWQTSARQEQVVRRSLYKSLIDAGVEAVVDVGTRLMKLLRRNSE